MVRLAPQAEKPAERLAIALELAPEPVLYALFGPAYARVLHVSARTGLLARLAGEPATVHALAHELDFREAGLRGLLDCLAAMAYVEQIDDDWLLSARGRRWLDPASPTSVLGYVDHTHDYWEWWAGLEDFVRGGAPVAIHEAAAGDPSWERYIRGQYELARLSSPEVARGLRLGARPRRLLDLAGGHGWFAAELCLRHPGLEAVVLDLPGSVAVGAQLMEEQGMADRVRHVEGDLHTADLGGPYDAALVFNIVHHLTPDENARLLRRVHDALRPGGSVAVLDLWTRPPGERPDSAAFLGLFFQLTSAGSTYGPAEFTGWLAAAGFGAPRRVPIRRLPAQTLYQAVRD